MDAARILRFNRLCRDSPNSVTQADAQAVEQICLARLASPFGRLGASCRFKEWLIGTFLSVPLLSMAVTSKLLLAKVSIFVAVALTFVVTAAVGLAILRNIPYARAMEFVARLSSAQECQRALVLCSVSPGAARLRDEAVASSNVLRRYHLHAMEHVNDQEVVARKAADRQRIYCELHQVPQS